MRYNCKSTNKCDFSSACYLNEPIDSSNIESLENCTLVEGFIQILRHPFENHRKFFADGLVLQFYLCFYSKGSEKADFGLKSLLDTVYLTITRKG